MNKVLFTALAFAFPLFLSANEPLAVGSLDIGYVGTNNTDETVSNRLLIEGTLRKVGDGILTLPLSKVSSLNGSIQVLDGALAVTADGTTYELADKPTALLAKAAFWVEANTNVVTFLSNDVNNVSQWLDVREPSPAGPYQYLRAVSQLDKTNVYPVCVATGAGINNDRAYVDFGSYQSGRWMAWQNASSNVTSLTTIRNVFIVHGAYAPSYGYLLGITNGVADFHKGNVARVANPLWIGSSETAKVKTGRTFLDRQRVDGTVVYPKEGYQLLEVETGRAAGANNFFNDRGYANRQGGDRLCEVLIYTNLLSEAERLQVEQYLWQKWVSTGQDLPGLSAADGLSASVAVADGMTQALKLGGDGTFVKSGAGTLLMDVTTNTPLFNGQVRFDSGLLDLRLPVAIQPTGGTRLTGNTNILTLAAAGDASQLFKSGTGELVLREVPSGVTRIAVEQGILQFAHPLPSTAWPADTVGVIPNPSFEVGTKVYANGETFAGWTATIPVPSDGYSSVQINPQGLVPYPAPDGAQVLMLKGSVGVETTLSLPAGGVYVLSFLASARADQTPYQEFDILIDGTNRVATVQARPPDYQRCRYRLPWLAAGAHTLRLQSVANLDLTATVDDFHADLLTTEEPLNVLTNASFECVAYTANKETNAPAGTGWNFTTSMTASLTNLAVISSVGGVHALAPDYGRRMLYIKNQGSASTTMTFPASGTYQLFFNIANSRTVYKFDDNWQPLSVTVNVGGVDVGTLTTTSQTYVPMATAPFTVTAGVPVTLTLTGTTLDNRVLLIDEITARKSVAGNLIQNGGFELGAGMANWALFYNTNVVKKSGAGPITYSTNAPNYYGTSFFEGSLCVRVIQTGGIKQTVNFAEQGTYRLTFHAVTRVNLGNPDTYGKNPVVAWVSKDGVTNQIGYVKADEAVFCRHAFFFTVPVAGDYDIGLQGQDSTPTGDKTALIDGVSVEKVELADLGTMLPKQTSLDVAAGAKLNLNYIGTTTVDLFRYAGKTLVGTITSATNPEFVYGSGAIYSAPKGTLIVVQ